MLVSSFYGSFIINFKKHEAVDSDTIDMVKLLMDHGANVNAYGYQNNTPLHEATLNGRFECAKYLLENGANQLLKNEFGIYPKDLANNNKKLTALYNKYASEVLEAAANSLSQSQFEVSSQTDRNDEINISNAYKGGRKTKAVEATQRRVLLFGTGMKDEDKVKLNELAGKLKLKVAKEMNSNGTIKKIKFIVGTNDSILVFIHSSYSRDICSRKWHSLSAYIKLHESHSHGRLGC
jgi:hypothetical protein